MPVQGYCYGSVTFSVTIMGNSSIDHVWGPLVVNLEGAGLQLLRAYSAVNATVVAGVYTALHFVWQAMLRSALTADTQQRQPPPHV